MPTEPPTARPRLYGDDAAWTGQRLKPFLDLACHPHGAHSLGFLGQAGIWDAKNYFESAIYSVEFHSCDNHLHSAPSTFPAWDDIFANKAGLPYSSSAHSPPKYSDSKRALHLLRRVWACAAANAGVYSSCEHSESQVVLLAQAVASADMTSFLTVTAGAVVSYAQELSWACGATMESGDVCTFDLATSYQVEFWSLWYDVMSSQPGLVSAANLTRIEEGLLFRVSLFRRQFHNGH